MGTRLAEMRQVAGLSQRELCVVADVPATQVSQIERGRVLRVTAHTVLALSDVFDVDMAWLYVGRGERPADNDITAAVESAREEALAAGRLKSRAE